jgi:hypothetical protein
MVAAVAPNVEASCRAAGRISQQLVHRMLWPAAWSEHY